MTLFLIRKLIAYAPLTYKNRGIFLGFLQQMLLVCNECAVCPEAVNVCHIFHCLDINMSIDHDIFHVMLYEKVLPHSQAETIMKYDYFFLWQDFAKPSVGLHIELFQESAGNMAGNMPLMYQRDLP